MSRWLLLNSKRRPLMRLLKLTLPVQRLLRSSIVVALILGTASCLGACVADQTGGPEINAACDAFNPVRWSHKDTPDTIRQVVGNNAAGVSLCPRVKKWHP